MLFVLLPGEVREGREKQTEGGAGTLFARQGDAGPIALEEWQLI